jgi:uncharacterized MAPEG superfamily protein
LHKVWALEILATSSSTTTVTTKSFLTAASINIHQRDIYIYIYLFVSILRRTFWVLGSLDLLFLYISNE